MVSDADNRRFTLPDPKGYDRAHELAYKLALEKLSGINIEQQCLKSDARCHVAGAGKTITIRYLGQSYLITVPDIKITPSEGNIELPLRERLLILHYFISAKGTPIADRLINFRDLPEGTVYSPTFSQRTVKPLLDHFGKRPHLLVETSKRLGGYQTDYGDTSVTIDAFSRVPVTIILWHGDEELAPQGNIVFDATIPDYLPTEDITVLCETITWKLIRYSREP